MTPKDFFHDDRVAKLAYAASHSELNVAREAIAQGANPRAVGERGVTPLYIAVVGESEIGVRFLLDAGADPQPAPPALSILNQAAKMGQLPIVNALIDAGADPIAVHDSDENALGAAVLARQDEIVDALLKRGVAVNAPTDVLNNPLTIAYSNLDRWDRVLYLLDQGADPYLHNRNGATIAWEVSQSDDFKDRSATKLGKLKVRDWLKEHNVPVPGPSPAEIRAQSGRP